MYELHPYQKKLVQQTRQELANGKNSVLIQSPAGSGKSVVIAEIARLTVKKGGYVLFMVHRKELVEQITQSFTDNDVNLSHCTIMTVGKIKNRLDKLPKPSLIITDETHHSLAKTYRDIYKHYSDVPRIGFTATPWRMNGKGLGDVYNAMVQGESVKWLIDHQYLAPFKYYSVPNIDLNALKKSSTGDYTNDSINEALGTDIFGNIVKTYKKLAKNQQAIVYAHNVEYSKRYADEFNKQGISARHCDAKTPATERKQIMSDFKEGKIRILCNVDLIGEGFNFPDVPVIMLLRPTASLVVDIQQSMRGMRYKPGKTSIIIDEVKNVYKHGFPDDERFWSLQGSKKEFVPSVATCTVCLQTFYSDKWAKACLLANHKSILVCPYCGAPKPANSRGPRKGKETDENAKLVELNNKKGRLTVMASKNPKRQRSLASIYQVLNAQKQLNIGNVNYPLPRAMHIRLDQTSKIDESELGDLSHVSGKSIIAIQMSYRHALETHQTKQSRQKNLTFNF